MTLKSQLKHFLDGNDDYFHGMQVTVVGEDSRSPTSPIKTYSLAGWNGSTEKMKDLMFRLSFTHNYLGMGVNSRSYYYTSDDDVIRTLILTFAVPKGENDKPNIDADMMELLFRMVDKVGRHQQQQFQTEIIGSNQWK